MNRSLTLFLVGYMLLGQSAVSADAQFHALFKPLRVTRVGELYQVELAVELMNLLPAPANTKVTFLGSRTLASRYHVPFGTTWIDKGRQADLVTTVYIPEREWLGWQRQDALPRLRVEHVGPAAGGTEVIEAVPAGPADSATRPF